MYRCAVCNLPVIVVPVTGEIVRGCSHDGASVTASLTATCHGVSSTDVGEVPRGPTPRSSEPEIEKEGC
jgi:hypothetical protein